MVLVLKPHQEKAVNDLSNGKILVGGVGTGKTITSLTYFSQKILNGEVGSVDLYVITTARKRDSLDWQREAAQLSIIPTVDSWNNIEKYEDVKDAFFIFDEQRIVGSGSWVKAFLKIAKQNRWILLSATPGDTWLDYIPVFIANGFYKNRTQFKREHVVYNNFSKFPKVDHYISVGKLVRLRKSILVDMPYERHTTRHVCEIPVDYDRELFRKVVKDRWHVYENRPLKDVAELFAVMRKVVNTDQSRLSVLTKLISTHSKVIVFYNFDYELEILRNLLSTTSSTTTQDLRTLRTSSHLANTANRNSVEEMDHAFVDQTNPLTANLDEEEKWISINSLNSARPNSDLNSNHGNSDYCVSTSKCGNNIPMKSSPRNSIEILPNEELSKPVTGSIITTSRSGNTLVNGVDKRSEQSTNLFPTVQIAEWNGHKHDPVPTSDRWVYLVQYVAGAEAWNCTSTDTVVFYSLTYSYKNFMQAMGRIDRLDTAFLKLFYYVLISKAPIDVAVSKALKNKKSFNERNFMS